MKTRTIFLCLCALILLFGIVLRYFDWRDNTYLVEEQVVENVKTFEIN